ncbi:hypothetical protein ACET3Z_005178 [Daucus carota]
MGDNKVLRFFWRASVIEVKVDVDKCNIMDVVIDYEDEAKRRGVKLDYAFPAFRYAFKMEHQLLVTDRDLMKMFERLAEREVIHICVGTTVRPNELYKTVLNFRRRTELKEKQGETEGNGKNEGNQVEEVNDQGGILFLSTNYTQNCFQEFTSEKKSQILSNTNQCSNS